MKTIVFLTASEMYQLNVQYLTMEDKHWNVIVIMEKMAIFGIRTIYVNMWNAQLLVLYWEMGLATELAEEPVLNCICVMIDPQLNKIF